MTQLKSASAYLSNFKQIGTNLAVKFIKPVYISTREDKRDEVGSRVYRDANWANLFKSQLVDNGLVSRGSFTAVVKLDIDDPDVACIKQFRFLENSPLGASEDGLLRISSDPTFRQLGEKLINLDLAIDFEKEYGVGGQALNFFAVECKEWRKYRSLETKPGFYEEDIVRVARKYGKPGIYVPYAVGEFVNFVVLIHENDVLTREVFHYFYPR